MDGPLFGFMIAMRGTRSAARFNASQDPPDNGEKYAGTRIPVAEALGTSPGDRTQREASRKIVPQTSHRGKTIDPDLRQEICMCVWGRGPKPRPWDIEARTRLEINTRNCSRRVPGPRKICRARWRNLPV